MKRMEIVAMMAVLIGSVAMAAESDAKVKKAEAAMMAACKKEYPAQVKGKKFNDVAEWVETEERGDNKETFKKSKCYNLHEEWEKVAEHSEKDESKEHRE